jgi:hypothetical protein
MRRGVFPEQTAARGPFRWILCGCLLGVIASALAADPPLEDPRLVESRTLVAGFADGLQQALKQALEEGGPIAAIPVCRDLAPRLASEASRASGAAVGRTSRRFRNPQNAPEPWQAVVLQTFEVQMATGVAAVPEYFSVAEDGSARYMKAIVLAPLCVVCHGQSLSPELARVLDAEYPHDRGTGYSVGDLRGAFAVFWPAPQS